MLLPGFEPDPVHEALAAVSRAADAACSAAAFGGSPDSVLDCLARVERLVREARWLIVEPVDKPGGP
jgi:hypothetical protein